MASRSSRNRDSGGSSKDKDKNKSRSRSPHERPLSEDDLKRIVSETLRQQIPSLILETSKVVTEQITSDAQDSTKSFTSFSSEMKQLKQRQEEVANLSKAAALKSDGKTMAATDSALFHDLILFSFLFFADSL